MAGFRVIIIGGGLSGALLGCGLLTNDVDFTLYEREHEDAKHEGYQIRLGEGSLRGFSACLTPSQTEAIMRTLGKSAETEEAAPSVFNSRFERLVDFSKFPSYAKSSAINRVVLRNLLMGPIKESGRVSFEKHFTHYELVSDEGAERVRVHFKDGSSDTCDLLIGADGSRSQVLLVLLDLPRAVMYVNLRYQINRQIGLDNLVPLSSHWAFLSKGPVPYERILQLPRQLVEGPIMVFANNMSFYCALYLPEDLRNQASSNDRQRIISYDEEAGSFYWGLSIPVERLPYKTAEEMVDRRQICLDALKDWAPEFHRMLSTGHDNDASVHVTKFNASTEPKLNWRDRVSRSGSDGRGHPRVWLLGDAIHAMQPNRGQGGNQAMSDCADILPRILELHSLATKDRDHVLTESELNKACREYEAAMIPRAFTWVRKSGGSKTPGLDLDGWLGTIVKVVAFLVVPVMQWYKKLV